MEEMHVMSDAGRDAPGYIGGGILALSLVPQIIKLMMTKSAADISLMWSLLYLIGTSLSFVYLLLLGALAAWVPVAVEVVGCAITITLKLVYDYTEYGKRQQLQLQQDQFQKWQLQYANSMKLAALVEEKEEKGQIAAGAVAGTAAAAAAATAATAATAAPADITMLIQDPLHLTNLTHPSAGAGTATLDISNHSKASSSAPRQKSPKNPASSTAAACGVNNNSGNGSAAPAAAGTFLFGSPASANAASSAAMFSGSLAGYVHSPPSPAPLPWYSQTGISHTTAIPFPSHHCCHVCGAPQLAGKPNNSSCNTSQSGGSVVSRAISNLFHSFTNSRGSGGGGSPFLPVAPVLRVSGAGAGNASMVPVHRQVGFPAGAAAAAPAVCTLTAAAALIVSSDSGAGGHTHSAAGLELGAGAGAGTGGAAAESRGGAAGARAPHRLSLLGASSTTA